MAAESAKLPLCNAERKEWQRERKPAGSPGKKMEENRLAKNSRSPGAEWPKEGDSWGEEFRGRRC